MFHLPHLCPLGGPALHGGEGQAERIRDRSKWSARPLLADEDAKKKDRNSLIRAETTTLSLGMLYMVDADRRACYMVLFREQHLVALQ